MQNLETDSTLTFAISDTTTYIFPLGYSLPKDTIKKEDTLFSDFSFNTVHPNYKKDSIVYRKSIFTNHELPKQGKEREIYSNNNLIISFLLIFSLFILAFLYKQYKKQIGVLFKACFSNRHLLQIKKESKVLRAQKLIGVFILTALVYSLVFFRANEYFSYAPHNSSTNTILILAGFTICFLFLVIKYIWGTLITVLFNDKELTFYYISHILTSCFSYSILLIPFIILSYLSNVNFANSFTIISSIIFLISYLIYLFRCLIVFFGFSKFSKLYLFLYLCTVEILPVFTIIKLGMLYLSK